jgi:hypothetical protein
VKHYRGTWLNHTLLSPSGKASKRARKAAEQRMGEALQKHAERYDREHAVELEASRVAAEAKARQDKIDSLRRSAQTLRDLADRGMRPVYHHKHATRIDAEAAALEAGP